MTWDCYAIRKSPHPSALRTERHMGAVDAANERDAIRAAKIKFARSLSFDQYDVKVRREAKKPA
jgi:hypothetical protein